MERKRGRRADAASDVETVLDDLYTTPPPGFVARREELAVAARTAGRAEDSRRIRAARRPTLAAWAANLLLRSQPEESRRFLELGQALRDAYRTLDADGIKELSEQRRSVVSALSRQAAELARAAGHRLSDAARQDVESTLRAVLTDEDAADQWATGRLEGALTPPSDFPSPTGTTTAPGTPRKSPKRTAAPSRSASATRAKDDLADRRRRKRQEELARARKAAADAERRLRDRRAEQADADASSRQARDRHDQAREKTAAAERQLRQAREELERAARGQQKAEDRLQAAADALARAEQAAREAAAEVERLATSDG
ncbi:hypothetical protein [Streptomyces caeruleatus]|uniref:Uncharacterized protein n=1 Tax=Streptomyces caeruleatus TaxID=661399 RepID=A0A117RPW7_9ACTN|nr:hypothetical protein [Streptomyces caeruleatus]KUO02704.1 hypothetical protein AQJ67_19860 [Streptomyces caeruleatus]